ncbi:MAG: RHS repeat-associated core domain-containing protein [Terriglobia bacterium]
MDIGTGEVIHEVTDFHMVSPIPARLTRRYVSSVRRPGMVGWGWLDNFAPSLTFDESSVRKIDPIDGDSVFLVEQCDGKLGPVILSRDQVRVVLQYPDLTEETYLADAENWQRWLLVMVQDANRNRLIYHYVGNRLARIESPMLNVDLEYSHTGLLSRLSVATGHDGRALMSVLYEQDGDLDLVGWSGDCTEPVRCSYKNHLLVRVRANTGAVNYLYDAGGRCISSFRDGDSLTRMLKYDTVRSRTLVVDSYGRRTLFTTNENGVVKSHVDANGNVTERLLDGEGGIIAGVLADGSVALGDTFDPEHRELRTPDAAGNVWFRNLDEKGRLVRIISPSGATKQYRYDEEGRIKECVEWNGGMIQYRYDDRGELEAFVDETGYEIRRELSPDGSHLRLFDSEGTLYEQTFDFLDNVVSDVDASGRVTRYTYRAMDIPEAAFLPGGGAEHYDYDAALNLTAITDPLGRVRRFEYDTLGNLIADTDPLGGRVRYEYDLENNRTAVVNRKGERLEIEYNDIGEEISWKGFDGKLLRFELDPLRRRAAVIDAAGDRITLTHQGYYDIETRTFPDGAVEQFELTSDGQLASVTLKPPEGSGETPHFSKFVYDNAAKIVAETHDGASLQYEWDRANYVMAIRDSLGDETRYIRSSRHRVEKMIDRGREYTFRYLPTGEIVEITYPNGLRQTFDYDQAGRMSRRRMMSADDKVLTWRRFGYDLADQLIAMEDWHWGTFRYTYDANGRIVEVRNGGGLVVESYRYDETGNLIDCPLAPGAMVGRGDRLTAAGGETLEYDSPGNLVARHGTDDWRYEWDRDGNLRCVLRNGILAGQYEYDRFNRRTRKTTSEGTVSFLYEGLSLRAEALPNGSRTHYVTLPDIPIFIGQARGSEFFFYAYDQIGTPVEVFDERGELVLATHSHAFGGARDQYQPAGLAPELPFNFVGQYRDSESSLFYNIFRYYDPRLGRYISQDPLGLCAALNFYQYPADPFTDADPDGLGAVKFYCMSHWGACQKWYAKEKIKAINNSTHARKACTCCRKKAQKRDFQGKKCADSSGKRGRAYKGRAIDHMHEIQAGGPDRCCSNLRAVEKVFNAELGQQTKKMLAKLKYKELITKATAINCESDEPCSEEGKENVAIPPPAGPNAPCEKKDDKPLSCKC